MLLISQALVFCSHPGVAEDSEQLTNDGMDYNCEKCGRKHQKGNWHSPFYGICIPRYQGYDKELCNEIGLQNYMF